jgi:hypothetical protein
MHIRMKNLEGLTLPQMAEFVSRNQGVECEGIGQQAVYGFVGRILQQQRYGKLSKGDRGIVRAFLLRVTGLSRAQITRLISRWTETRKVERKPPQRPNFQRRYTQSDIVLLAEIDAVHEDLSGPAVRHLLRRELEVYGNRKFARLAGISVSHIYNLRRRAEYRKLRVRVQHTQARQVAIAERRKPDPKGRPGYIRVDTVHQGQKDGKPGVYHINAVDTVTQWEAVGCVATICERDLIPVLEAMLHQFPFRVIGFHCDNGSEFLNRKVAALLQKLLVEEFTKSRAYKTTDNALVEGKNGSVVRRQIGYGAIGSEHAEAFQKFYTAYLNPYLNFHHPCGFATITTSAKGKRRRVYKHDDYRTPYEKLTSLNAWQKHLKEGVNPQQLQREAERISDTEAARRMQKAKLALLTRCRLQGER